MCTTIQDLNVDSMNEGRKEDAELPSFSLSEIAKATSNFSITNKLGEGGFGPVYKVTNILKQVVDILNYSCFLQDLLGFLFLFTFPSSQL